MKSVRIGAGARRPAAVAAQVKERRSKPAQNGNRREDLLRVCARLFREKGFDGTSIRDIPDAARMRSGSPFYHFKTKQDMLLGVLNWTARWYRAGGRKSLDQIAEEASRFLLRR